jgi:zinc-finger of acetyl-transferase ESCO
MRAAPDLIELDRELGIYRCGVCLLVFCPDVAEDQRFHRRYHAQVLHGERSAIDPSEPLQIVD